MKIPRYIDADVMREEWLQNGENEHVYDTNAILESIDSQPTVDAVEVVRCKDCVQSEPLAVVTVNVFCNEWAMCISCDGFCHKGRKKNAAD
jgi:hypothetical protein